jgi:TonB family protein
VAVGQRRLEAARRPDTGTAGRAQARRDVEESLAQTRNEVKETLAEVTSVLSAVRSSNPTKSVPRRGQPGGGRSRDELEQVAAVTAGADSEGEGPITAGLLDIGSITDVRSDLASADPSVVGGGGVGGRRRGASRAGESGGDGGGVEPGAHRSNASLLATVRRYAPGIQYCYDNELKRDLSLSGKMVLALTVLPSGVVSEVEITHDSLGSSRLQECVLSQVREWRFPAIPEGTVSFQAPFVFTPPES